MEEKCGAGLVRIEVEEGSRLCADKVVGGGWAATLLTVSFGSWRGTLRPTQQCPRIETFGEMP
jgi:hypothetical protein